MSLATAARSASQGARTLTASLQRVQRSGGRVANAAAAIRTFGVTTAGKAQLGHFDISAAFRPQFGAGRALPSHVPPAFGAGRALPSHVPPPFGAGRRLPSHILPLFGAGRTLPSHVPPPFGAGRRS